MGEWIIEFVSRLGVFAVFLLSLLETVFPPIPSELIMPLAGYLASRGDMSLTGAIVGGTLGSVLGAWVLYWVGGRYGLERLLVLADRHGRWLTLSRCDIERSSTWFARHGNWAVLICRLIPGLRSLISIPAGIHRMPLGRFLLVTALGSAIWTALLVYLGYVLGRNFEHVGEYVGVVSEVVIAMIVVTYLWRLARSKRADASSP